MTKQLFNGLKLSDKERMKVLRYVQHRPKTWDKASDKRNEELKKLIKKIIKESKY